MANPWVEELDKFSERNSDDIDEVRNDLAAIDVKDPVVKQALKYAVNDLEKIRDNLY